MSTTPASYGSWGMPGGVTPERFELDWNAVVRDRKLELRAFRVGVLRGLITQQDLPTSFWGPSSYMRRDGRGLVYNNLRLMSQALPKLHVYIVSLQKMLQFDELFKRETGKDRGAQRSGGGGGGGDDAVTDQRAPSCIPETEILQHFLSTWGFQFSTPKRIATAS
ncbi:hypothetical protein CRUP_008146 [Coryphaenoides rupestris]|nr:hypothetical protein CRUP_008146 [Coryphaenoides rupestris]